MSVCICPEGEDHKPGCPRYVVPAANELAEVKKRVAELEKQVEDYDQEITDYDRLINLQHSRTVKADKLWQEAHNKPDTTPDLGNLIEWLMGQIAESRERERWIPVEERMPARSDLPRPLYEVWDEKNSTADLGLFIKGGFVCRSISGVTHWRQLVGPLPPAPAQPSEADKCQLCHGKQGGVPGNENIVDGVILCDYCTVTHHFLSELFDVRPKTAQPSEEKK
jgi:hypothetical protein